MLALALPPYSLQENIGKATTCHTERKKTTREGMERGIPYGLLTDGAGPVYNKLLQKTVTFLIYFFYEYCATFNGIITECFYSVQQITGKGVP
jgi:hypothetical protein